jgi:4-carboxymuconolactone decarboxylase
MPERQDRAEAIAHGLAVRKEVLGVTTRPSASDAVVPDLGPLSDEVLWGRIWGRPGLDLQRRSLCVVVALLTLERYDYARAHIRGARNLGVSRTEMAEAVVQLTFYVGLPVVHEGLRLVAEVYGHDD